jgi:hypothetical protein
MSLLYSCGDLYNLLARGTVTCNPAALATAPLAALYDAKPNPFQFGSIAAGSYVQLRNNVLTNMGFETALGTEWTAADTGTGASVRITTDQHTGAACLQVNGGAAGVSARYQSITVRAGEALRADFWSKPGVGRTARLRVYCVETGQWCNAGTWQAGAADLVTVTNTASWTRCAVTTFTMPTYATALWPTLTLQVYCYTTDNGNVLFDDAAIIPAVNGMAVSGHNINTGIVLTLNYSDDAFAVDNNVYLTPTLARPSFYAYSASPIYREYWRLLFTGTPSSAPYISEAWIGAFTQAGVAQLDGWSVSQLPVARVAGTDDTTALRYRRNVNRERHLELSFEYWNATERDEMMRDIDARTYGGYAPIVIVPSTTSSEAPAIHGRIDPQTLKLVRTGPVIWNVPLVITEMAFPVIGA